MAKPNSTKQSTDAARSDPAVSYNEFKDTRDSGIPA